MKSKQAKKPAGRRIRISRERFANTGQSRGATKISFRLSRAARVVVGVKGPGPSCELAGRLPVSGKKGLNEIRFDGTVRKVTRQTVDGVTLEFPRQVTLEPGTYLLELTSRAGKRRLARTFVTIVDPNAPKRQYLLPQCSSRGRVAVSWPTDGAVLASTGGAATLQGDLGKSNAKPVQSKTSEVLGEVGPNLSESTPEASGLPLPGAAQDGAGRSFLETFVLGLVVAAALAVAAAFVLLRGRRQLI